jgi:hypothetical protein
MGAYNHHNLKKTVMSHVKNLQSFDKVIEICTGLGKKYNPGQQKLQVNAMTTQLNIAQQAWEELKQAHKAYDNATNARLEGFQGVRSLSSSVYGMLKVCEANPLLLSDALKAKRKVWGARITKPPEEPAEPTEAVKRAARKSYSKGFADVAEYFDELVKTVASESRYSANEPHLSLEGLKQRVIELNALNKAVADAEVLLDEARIKRNQVFYLAADNMVSTANAVKTYVRIICGYLSPEHEQILKLNIYKPSL